MKKLLYLPAVIAGLWLSSCSDDIGNYDYKDINEVSVDPNAPGSVEEGKTYELFAYLDHFNFDPQLNSTFGKTDENAYEYEWKVIPVGAIWESVDESKIVIATTRKLTDVVSLSPGTYSAFFNVKDKETGITWTTQFRLQIKSMTEEGWLVLCDNEGKTRLDLICNRNEEEEFASHDILNTYDNDAVTDIGDIGRPVKLLFDRYQQSYSRAMLVTDKDTYCFDGDVFKVGEQNSLRWHFGDSNHPVRIKASMNSANAGSNNNLWVIIDDNDEINTLNNTTQGSMFEFPITKLQGTEPFTPAPFIAANINQQAFSPGKEGQGSNPSVMYDATNRQFVEIKHGSYYPSVMDFSGDKQLFQNPTGRDMVFMAPSRHGPIYAVLRDPSTKETYFYGFMMHGNGKSNADSEGWNVQVCHGKINGPGVENATLFAFHPLHNYIFYAVGGSIYRFNWLMPDTPATEVINLSGEEISVLKFNSFRGPFPEYSNASYWQYSRNYRLVVGSNATALPQEKCGNVRFYNVPDLMQPLSLHKEHNEFGKIIDIVYKERLKK